EERQADEEERQTCIVFSRLSDRPCNLEHHTSENYDQYAGDDWKLTNQHAEDSGAFKEEYVYQIEDSPDFRLIHFRCSAADMSCIEEYEYAKQHKEYTVQYTDIVFTLLFDLF